MLKGIAFRKLDLAHCGKDKILVERFLTIHFAAEFPDIGVCLISDTAVSTKKNDESRKRVSTTKKVFYSNRGSGVLVAGAGNGDLCDSVLRGLIKDERQANTPESVASWMQKTFPELANGKGAEFIVAGRDRDRLNEFQIAVLQSQPSAHQCLAIVPQQKQHATIGFQATVFNAEFCGYLQKNIQRMLNFSPAVPEKVWSIVADSREGFALGIIGGGLVGLAQDVVSGNKWEEMIGGPWTATCIPLSGPIFQTSGEMYNGAKLFTGAHIDASSSQS